MSRENKNCAKCSQIITYPYYEIFIEEKHTESKKTFCLGCWKQEEKNYRKMSEEYFDRPWGCGLKYVHKYEAHLTITIIHWVEELKQWRCGKEKDDYDEDVNTWEDKDNNDNRERERERESKS